MTSSQALADPFTKYLTLDRDFVSIGLLAGIVGDSHFVTRDRMGRTLAFMCRTAAAGWTLAPRAIAVDEETALEIDGGGIAAVVGNGKAYFLRAIQPAEICQPKTPLTYSNVDVYRVGVGGTFDLAMWSGGGGAAYQVSATAGVSTAAVGMPS